MRDQEYKDYQKNYYQLHREHRLDYKSKRRQEAKTWLDDLMNGLCCELCGEAELICLDFHHINKDEKELEISRMIWQLNSRMLILEEMGKCVLLCSNCHRKVHKYGLDFMLNSPVV